MINTKKREQIYKDDRLLVYKIRENTFELLNLKSGETYIHVGEEADWKNYKLPDELEEEEVENG